MPSEISVHYLVGVKRAFARRIHAIRDNENLIFFAVGVLIPHSAAFATFTILQQARHIGKFMNFYEFDWQPATNAGPSR
jgi:hypothetical protein